MTKHLQAAIAAVLIAGTVSLHAQTGTTTSKPKTTAKKTRTAKKKESADAAAIRELQDKLAAQQAQIDELKQQNAAKDTALSQAQSTASTAQSQAAEATSQAQAATAAAQTQAQQVDTLKSTVSDIQSTNVGLAQTLNTTKGELNDAINAPTAIHYKGVAITPVAFFAFENVWRQRAVNSDINTPFNSIPFPSSNQGFTRDGQRLGSTGQLNTIWNDDGEGLINEDWYGILFGAACAWQEGESSIDAFEQSYGQVFHGDTTGSLDQAQKELMTAHEILKNEAKVGDGTDNIFWLDPWSRDGQKIAAEVLPYAHDLRMHAEAALTLIAHARAAAGPNPAGIIEPTETGSTAYQALKYGAATSGLREPDAVDAMELGARRMDFIGLKFQLADEMAQGYARAIADSTSTDRKTRAETARELSDINGVNGRIQDIRNGYTLLRDMYESAWLRSNRPYWLRNILEQYDYAVQIWLARADKIHSAQRQWADTKTLPSAFELGIPQPLVTAPAFAPVAPTNGTHPQGH